MKRVLINRLLENFEERINNVKDDIPNDIADASPPFTIDTANFNEFKEYALNALKQLKSNRKTLTIEVGNSSNDTGYSVLSGKSQAVESDYGFISIVGFKIIFKVLKYPNMNIYMYIRDLTLHFEDGTVISGTPPDLYDPDDPKVLTPGALTMIFNKIKEIVDSIRDIVDGPKDRAKSIEKITNNIKDI
jgi:hypothetical protein